MHALIPELLTASQPLRVPGGGTQRVLTVQALQRVADEAGMPRWRVEAVALREGLVPLPYLRHLRTNGAEGQAQLLESSVGLIGSSPALAQAADLLAAGGVGRIAFLSVEPGPHPSQQLWAEAARNRNGSVETRVDTLSLTDGNPADALAGLRAVGAALTSAGSEQLLQFACRMRSVPGVFTACEGEQAQCYTVLPSRAGAALVYRSEHPHLAKERRGLAESPRACLLAGGWMAEELLRLLLGRPPELAGRLRWADLALGQLSEFPLGGPE